jgi:hypothetical protein
VIFEPRKSGLFVAIHQQWYTCPIALPVHRNPQHVKKSCDCCLSHFRTWSGIPCDCRTSLRISRPSCESPYAPNTSHHKQETLLYEYPLQCVLLPTKSHNTLLFNMTFLKDGRHFDYWYQPLNIRMRVFRYLACHEAGLCCYLVIHIESLLHPLQLIYFHLWLIYWLFLVYI